MKVQGWQWWQCEPLQQLLRDLSGALIKEEAAAAVTVAQASAEQLLRR